MLYGMPETRSRSTIHSEQRTFFGGVAAAVTVTVTGGGLAGRSIARYVATNVFGLLCLRQPLEEAAASAARHVQRDFSEAAQASVSIFAALLDPALDELRYVQFGNGTISGAENGYEELHRREDDEQRAGDGESDAAAADRQPFADRK